jgi:hypothetical protein
LCFGAGMPGLCFGAGTADFAVAYYSCAVPNYSKHFRTLALGSLCFGAGTAGLCFGAGTAGLCFGAGTAGLCFGAGTAGLCFGAGTAGLAVPCYSCAILGCSRRFRTLALGSSPQDLAVG